MRGDVRPVARDGGAVECVARHQVILEHVRAKGADVIRYGEVICIAAEDIKPGDWIHVHNTTIE